MKSKTYTNGEIAIVWKPALCMHSAICVQGLPSVFKPQEKPWIVMDGATSRKILNQVNQCPSGALSIVEQKFPKADKTDSMEQQDTSSELQVIENGPVKVAGPCKITYSDGSEETIERAVFLCRCGQSTKKPFCDGTHKKAGFVG